MSNDASVDLSPVIIALMKGVTYRDADPALWQALVSLSARVREHVVVLGLDLVLDEAEGYAYPRSGPRRRESRRSRGS